MCQSRSTPQRVCSREQGDLQLRRAVPHHLASGKLSGARGGQPDPRCGVVQRPAMHERCVRSGIRHADRHHEWRDYSRCQLHAGVVHGHDDVTGAARIRRHRAFLSAGAFDERWLGAVCVPSDCRRLAVGADARRCQRRPLRDTGCVRPPSLHGRCQRRQRMRHRADIYAWTYRSARSRSRRRARPSPLQVAPSSFRSPTPAALRRLRAIPRLSTSSRTRPGRSR